MSSRARHLPAPLRHLWHLLSDVPGWPDAPLRSRLLRIAPIIVPLMLTVLLLLWQHLVHAPQHTRTLAAYSPLLGLEAELAQLRESAAALSAPENKTDSSSALILNPQEAFTVLEELKAKIGAHAWQFTYQLGEPEDPAPETPLLRSLRVRAKLTPTPQSSESFQQLMQVLPLFSQQSKRLELMRLTLRADEKENLQADLNLRFTLHAPTPAPAP